MKLVSAFLIGLVFGTGIVLSGMANPAKVIGFFDIAGNWDPSLIFVMASAMLTAMIGYRFVLKRPRPVFEREFTLPKSKVIDAPLVLGSLTFGIGWGISGFCPGGAIPALGTGRSEAFIFVTAMMIGIVATRTLRNMRAQQLLNA
ncbi:MAG: YeeE/YedE family protein [Nitratireductor sp.]|nr:YeeE/YedE family protein [Nitratireductor sp.]MCB1458954.1 YeeE/YedE family protein [Nitratireductor sp.]